MAKIKKLEGVIYNNSPKIEKFVFICGLHKSGTTLLEQRIVSHFDVACLRSTAPESEGQHMQNVYSPAKKFGGPGKFAFSDEMRLELERLVEHNRHCDDIMESWKDFIVGDSTVLVEKSPPNLTKIGWLRRVFSGAKFIIITRDPRAVSGATMKWAKTSPEALMMHWDVAHRSAKADAKSEDCLFVKYEDLCSSTDRILTLIETFAELERRKNPSKQDSRFDTIINTNDKYISLHECGCCGDGIWSEFGYSL